MSVEQNKAIVTRFNDALTAYFQTGDTSAMSGLIDPAAVINVPGMPPTVEGLLAVLPAFRMALSDFQMTISDLTAEGDRVAYRATWTAKHTGEFMGLPPTGNTVAVTETHLERLANGRIVEHTGNWDQMGLLQQLGALPAPA